MPTLHPGPASQPLCVCVSVCMSVHSRVWGCAQFTSVPPSTLICRMRPRQSHGATGGSGLWMCGQVPRERPLGQKPVPLRWIFNSVHH